MPSNFYDMQKTKFLLDIAESDQTDDELLDDLGETANIHVDNKLKQFDNAVPVTSSAIEQDLRAAANYYTASLYKGKMRDYEAAKYWKDMFDDVFEALAQKKQIDKIQTIPVDRF